MSIRIESANNINFRIIFLRIKLKKVQSIKIQAYLRLVRTRIINEKISNPLMV